MKSRENWATEGLSGKYKQVVFRQRFGETLLAKRPKKTDRLPSVNQLEVQRKFKDAITYAVAMLSDAAMKLAYGKGKVWTVGSQPRSGGFLQPSCDRRD
jgi:hypothetical protein